MQADAQEVKDWLENGADMAAVQKYMEKALNNAVAVYASMAKYMDEYAKGINL
ncbi:hypothetical protein F4779DRAFT_618257 [Xylariaceae sp. FL0662B]|nr:hypothetical protein F4779DRAFT_618257 [Xylariaceae sp. FL0662B]